MDIDETIGGENDMKSEYAYRRGRIPGLARSVLALQKPSKTLQDCFRAILDSGVARGMHSYDCVVLWASRFGFSHLLTERELGTLERLAAEWSKLPPEREPEPAVGPVVADSPSAEDVDSLNLLRDCSWVYRNLGNSKATDAPSPGAKEMLAWARKDQKQFLAMLARLQEAQAKRAAESVVNESGVDEGTEEVLRLTERVWKIAEEVKGEYLVKCGGCGKDVEVPAW